MSSDYINAVVRIYEDPEDGIDDEGRILKHHLCHSRAEAERWLTASLAECRSRGNICDGWAEEQIWDQGWRCHFPGWTMLIPVGDTEPGRWYSQG